MEPSPNGQNGRAGNGRFAPGWKGGPGNPHGRRVARLRSALLKSAKPDDVRKVMAALLAAAQGGDVAACREYLNRLVGPAIEIDIVERLAALEAKLEQGERQ